MPTTTTISRKKLHFYFTFSHAVICNTLNIVNESGISSLLSWTQILYFMHLFWKSTTMYVRMSTTDVYAFIENSLNVQASCHDMTDTTIIPS